MYPFDFKKVKVVIKRPKQDECETIFLDREWARTTIPHFTTVINNVNSSEGIEITLTCNVEAFKFAILYLESMHDAELLQKVMDGRVSDTNCLSLMVTCEFLQLHFIVKHIIEFVFAPNFTTIINNCKLNLNSLSINILKETCNYLKIDQILGLTPRAEKDYFINNLLKIRLDSICDSAELFQCTNCKLVLTQEQAEKVECRSKEASCSFVQGFGQVFRYHAAQAVPWKARDLVKHLRDD